MKNSFMVNLPYPKINISEKNPYYAKIILQNYAGMVSEFSAVSQYTYQKIKLFKSYPEISEVLLKISIVEMHHLEVLGKMIIELGDDPGFWIKKKDKYNYWSPKFVDYTNEPKAIIKSDITDELKAIKQYENSIKVIHDENINAILKRIILDEELHIKILTGIYDKYFSKC
ncbi:ferritin-like domain-containing protein [Clostridium cylindrosporum]|uniref:Rubrerythrin n=1 Tax=Clostridium cylindrosporum DSM 605 TaxID=1121307 RepID=A0A0J8DAV5_CLOCY|nr:ferritin family protein [Clostridium cylindrosporum]KMT23180.1 rubrerythrin [Clostridium cylindrosporum DSM 605]